jgi:integrase
MKMLAVDCDNRQRIEPNLLPRGPTMANSTRARSGAKSPPGKAGYPRTTPKTKKPPFPLRLHATGQWTRKVKGHSHYFGVDRDKALAEYMRVKEDLEAGRTPRPVDAGAITLMALCNHFLTDKISLRDSREITPRTYREYYATCELMLERLGKTLLVDQISPDDLASYRRWLSTKRNATTLGNEVTRVRVVLNYAFQAGLVDRPVRYGNFKRPAKRVLRRQRAEKGQRLFEAAELRKTIDSAGPQMRAMVLLAINAGLGNEDCAKLQFRHLNLDAGWLDYPRPKTGIARRCPLWAETVDALRVWATKRKEPADKANTDLVFLTKYGGPWSVDTCISNPISVEFRRLIVNAGVAREGLTFYVIRHTFQTVADETGDYLATKRVMGHADNSISDTYRERFPDERLRKVTDHVRTWLYGEGGA